jgi:deazaflavin-dependent oxidoreductase (nitroreductase family)
MTFYHKPMFVTRVMNSAMGFLASVGLTPSDTVTLEVKGRRSGQVRSTVVNTADVDGQRYLVSPRGLGDWVRNVRAAGGEAAIRHRGRKNVRLEELPPAQTAAIIQAYLKKTKIATKAHFGIDPDAPLAEFEKIAPRHPVFKITPNP